MTGEQMRGTLSGGGRAYGMMLGLVRSPRWARALVGSGLDFVVIDTEHSAYSRPEVADLAAAFDQLGIAPIVRIPIPDRHYVTMAMDAGAHGVMAPYCETVDQVKSVTGPAKWRPLKGALLDRAVEMGELPGEELQGYLAERNRNSFVIIGIESAPAAENLEAILEVQGVDAIFVGPHDLSCSLGIPEQYDHPEFEATVTRVLDACNARGLPLTIHFSHLELTRRWAKAGVRLVLHSSDIGLLPAAVRADFGGLREL